MATATEAWTVKAWAAEARAKCLAHAARCNATALRLVGETLAERLASYDD